MARFFILYAAILAAMPLYAQKAQIKVGYGYEVCLGGRKTLQDYILLTGTEGSMFYNPTALWMDINSRDEAARQAYGAMASQLADAGRHDEIPNRSASMYVFKDFDKQDKTVYDDYADQFAVYHEPFEEMRWEVVEDSSRTVLGYDCLMACCAYHGRDWVVWFAPEVPVQDGPWKFAGLPGLILVAKESKGIHSFIANGIESAEQEIPGMPRDDWYRKEERKRYLQGKWKFFQDPLACIAGGNLPKNAKVFVGGKEVTRGALQAKAREALEAGYDFLETDYH